MQTIFGVDWADLTLKEVSAYLQTADAEPLTWEAKGTRLDPGEVRRQVCAFANGHEVGYLILGARQIDGESKTTWSLDGLPFPDEPATWTSNVIGDLTAGVRPRPEFDVVAWEAEAGHVAVVRVQPTATPPCIANGTVYERLPGKSQQVRDPLVLADLYRRGDAARREAQARADRAAEAVLEDWLGGEAGVFRTQDIQLSSVSSAEDEDERGTEEAGFVRYAVGVAATGNPPNIAARLFRASLVADVWTVLRDRPGSGLPPGWGNAPDPVAWSQEALTWRHQTQGNVRGVTIVRAAWDGSVAMGQKLVTGALLPDSLVKGRIGPDWQFADKFIVERLRGFGDVYVTILVRGTNVPNRRNPGRVVMRRGPVLPGVDDELVASLSRELMRAMGNPDPEPEVSGTA
ncbi:MAG: RNA-binding domain-containing protein [Baekduia sp.]